MTTLIFQAILTVLFFSAFQAKKGFDPFDFDELSYKHSFRIKDTEPIVKGLFKAKSVFSNKVIFEYDHKKKGITLTAKEDIDRDDILIELNRDALFDELKLTKRNIQVPSLSEGQWYYEIAPQIHEVSGDLVLLCSIIAHMADSSESPYNWLFATFPKYISLPHYTMTPDEVALIEKDKEFHTKLITLRDELERQYKEFAKVLKKYKDVHQAITYYRFEVNIHDFMWAKYIIDTRAVYDQTHNEYFIPTFIDMNKIEFTDGANLAPFYFQLERNYV